VINGDSGIIIANELRTPPISPGQIFGITHATDQLQFLAFADYGVATNTKAVTGPGSSSSLLGVGPGIRYLVNPYFSVRADYGFQLKDANVPGITNHSRLELGAILSY
jgi:hemolysin activation/secretion protein